MDSETLERIKKQAEAANLPEGCVLDGFQGIVDSRVFIAVGDALYEATQQDLDFLQSSKTYVLKLITRIEYLESRLEYLESFFKEQPSEQGSQWEDYGFTIGSFM